MIRDRGTIKWTSMMLPEHVKQLKEWTKEDGFETMPELDEQQLEEINELIYESITLGTQLTMVYFDHHQRKAITGIVHSVDELNRTINVVSREGSTFEIPFSSIIQVNLNKT
ncbi:YolD-like family protein [Bacillus carboniphilus]|uniref:YolD-like family protein n=1 Tax=Bacillus carboniphilus TaxID=86663 RepID=A0ABY9JYJ4_9BACI|nr:YolD-like family protein [Bacillus carboniphilus]WLR43838.1 YolD-like family protein [Bacillus carboniphilus]